MESMELATGASPTWDREAFLAGKQTPVFFGSGVNNFGVMEVLDALVDLAPPPQPRTSTTMVNRQPVVKEIQPEDKDFAGVVFKVQANMDANHRDRIAFVRMASGKYTPGMKLQGAAHRQGTAPDQRRDLHEPAPRGGRRGLCRRHRRLHHARRRAAGRHHHRRRIAAVHRPALLRARAVHDRDPEEPAAHQAAAAGPGAARRGRRDPGVPARGRRPDAARRGRPAAVRSGAAPPEDRVRRRRAARRLPVHRRALDHGRHAGRAARVRQRLSAAHGAATRPTRWPTCAPRPTTCGWRRSAFRRSISIRCASMRAWRCRRRADAAPCAQWPLAARRGARSASSPTSTTR